MAPPLPATAKGADPGELKRLEQQMTKIAKRELDRIKQISAQVERWQARRWDATMLKAVLNNHEKRDAVLSTLYPKVAAEIRKDLEARSLEQGQAWARANPDEVKSFMEDRRQEYAEEGKQLTDAELKEQVILENSERLEFDDQIKMLQDRGLVGEPTTFRYDPVSKSTIPDPDQRLAAMIPDKPGVYFFAVTSDRQHEQMMLAVERAPDGSQRVWRHEELESGPPMQTVIANRADGHPMTVGDQLHGVVKAETRVYPLQPPPAGAKH